MEKENEKLRQQGQNTQGQAQKHKSEAKDLEKKGK